MAGDSLSVAESADVVVDVFALSLGGWPTIPHTDYRPPSEIQGFGEGAGMVTVTVTVGFGNGVNVLLVFVLPFPLDPDAGVGPG